MQKFHSLCLSIFMVVGAMAQVAEANNKESFGFWNQDLVQGNFGFANPELKNMRWWLEGQARAFDQLTHINQGLARGALGYNLSDELTFWAGYTWNPSRFDHQPAVDEHDLFPALTYTHKTNLGTFTARGMMDFRFTDTGAIPGIVTGKWRVSFIPSTPNHA